MIVIKNQLVAVFSIGDIQDFISPSNLISFELYENAGNLRPIFKMSFTLTNKKVLNYLNAGNILTVNFGIHEPNDNILQFELQGDTANLDYTLGNTVSITSALYLPEFTNKQKNHNYGNKYSYEVLAEIAKRHNLNFITNVNKTNDKQVWFQCGKTDWQYAEEVWMHSYINDDTFFAFGVDGTNMYFYDVRNHVQEGNKWTFTPKADGIKNTKIVNFAQYFTENTYGITSDLVGKNVTNTTFNINSGEFNQYGYSLKNFTTIDSNKLNINPVGCMDYTYNIISDDVHKNYIKAYNQNFRNNVLYSSFNIYIPTGGQIKKFKLIDTAEIIPLVKDDRITGTCFITSICYQYKENTLLTNVTLNKEAPSGIRGENLING